MTSPARPRANPFAPPSPQDVARLVQEHPFAWVVTPSVDAMSATPLPLRPVLDASGEVIELLGHFARSNPHLEQVRHTPRALVLFMGPHGYVSSSWLRDRTRTPTWNYAMAQYLVDIELIADAGELQDIIRDLVGAMEAGRERPWSIEEMGARYARLASGIVGFRARVVERRAKFKLGQDERDPEYLDILEALRAGGDDTLREWMERSNARR